MRDSEVWASIHDERRRLIDALEGLDADAWEAPSLCGDWTVSHVVAHLSAVAATGKWAWLRSIVLAGFNAARHNDRRMREHLGAKPAETLASFRALAATTVTPTKALAPMLGEVIVHGQDIARPLGLELIPGVEGLQKVARFYARRDFAVNSKSLVQGLTLRADDAEFTAGEGPLVEGRLLDLVMTMAGRASALASLHGEGVRELAQRLTANQR